jgi:hypothetical protein
LSGTLSVFHLRKDQDRRGGAHRKPNLLAWSKQLPPATQVVILDLGEIGQLNANAALELRARFSNQGRQPVIAGVSADQLHELNSNENGESLQQENICKDVELAIAQGLSLLNAKSS